MPYSQKYTLFNILGFVRFYSSISLLPYQISSNKYRYWCQRNCRKIFELTEILKTYLSHVSISLFNLFFSKLFYARTA